LQKEVIITRFKTWDGWFSQPHFKEKMAEKLMDSAQLMGQQGIFKLLVRFSVPAVAGMMVQALYNVVDRIYIGRAVGSVGIAATTISMPIMMLGFGFALMIGIGANALVSIRLGEQRKDLAEKVMGNAFILLLFTGVFLAVVGQIILIPALQVFGATDSIMPYAKAYMRIILVGWIFQTVGFGLNNFIRGEGNPKIAMLTMFIGAIANMILDPIFIFGFGWGMEGAAIATIIAQIISMVWVVYYFLGGKSLLKIRSRYFRLERSIVLRILAVGSPPFVMHLTDSGMSAIVNNQLRIYGGDIAISMLGIMISFMMMIFMFVIGIAQGTQPIIGYNFGARQYDRVEKVLFQGIMVVTVGVLIAYAIVMFFPIQLVSLFNKEDLALIQLGNRAIRIFFFMMPLLGFQALSSMFFQAIGKARQSMFLVLSRTVLFQVPGILLLPYFFGLDGIWLSAPVSMFASTILTASLLIYTLRHFNTN